MKKVCAGDLSSFLRSHKLTEVSSDVKKNDVNRLPIGVSL